MAGSAGFWLLAKLSGGMVCGVALGLCVNESVMAIIHTGKTLIGGVVFFVIPLVIFGFIAPTVLSLKASAGRMLGSFLVLSYLSSVGASLFATAMGSVVIPYLRIPRTVEGLRTIPKVIFTLEIPSLMPVVTALAFALLVGLSALWVKARAVEQVLYEFRRMMGEAISRVLVPLLPFFVAATFAELAYSGSLTRQLPLFAKVVAVVIVGHLLWLCVLYLVGWILSRKNPFEVLRHYGAAYATALGTMSSAATLPVSLQCAHKSRALPAEIVDFAIPLGATTHLCGSVLTETFFCLTIAQMLYGSMPSLADMVLFSCLFGIFAVGAPGVPGGTVLASLGLVLDVLHFDTTGTGLLIAIFALQDSFGTACNITGDGALALMLRGLRYTPAGELRWA